MDQAWLESRVDRARARLLADIERGRLDLGTLFAALRQITSAAPTEDDARLLAEAARCLPIDAYAVLLRAARDANRRGIELAVERALERVDVAPAARHEAVSDHAARSTRSGCLSHELFMIVQALTWAALPLEDQAIAPVRCEVAPLALAATG
jgi:hypothetical protein